MKKLIPKDELEVVDIGYNGYVTYRDKEGNEYCVFSPVHKKRSKYPNIENDIRAYAFEHKISYATAKAYVYILNSTKPRNKRIKQIMEDRCVSISVARKIEAEEFKAMKTKSSKSYSLRSWKEK